MIDLNNAAEQRQDGLIPDGAFVKVQLHLRPGGISHSSGDPQQDALDAGLFKDSANSDVIYIDAECKVLSSNYKGMSFYPFLGIAGGALESDGTSKAANITKSNLLAMINSATGLDPADKSERAAMMRRARGYKDFDGIEFYCRVSIQKGGDAPNGGQYPDKNVLAHIVEPNEPEWVLLSQGKDVPPQPRGARGGGGSAAKAGPVSDKPAWQQAAAPAAAVVATPAATAPAWAGGNGAAPAAPSAPADPVAPAAASPAAAPAASPGPSWLKK